jgi:hypothetical protein
LKLSVSLEITIVFAYLLYPLVQLLALSIEHVKQVRSGLEIFYTLLMLGEFIGVGLKSSVISLLLVFKKDNCPLLIFAGLISLGFSYTSISFFLHMMKHLLIELLEASSEFFVLFPDLVFVEFGIVG